MSLIKFDDTCGDIISRIGLTHMLTPKQLMAVDGIQITKERDNQLEADVRIVPNLVHRFTLTHKGWFRVGLAPEHPTKTNNTPYRRTT